jgi:hypothetical protein
MRMGDTFAGTFNDELGIPMPHTVQDKIERCMESIRVRKLDS